MPTRTSRPGVALTSRSSEVICAPAAPAEHSIAAATSRQDALICSRAMFFLELDFVRVFRARPRTACVVVPFTNAGEVPANHTDVTLAAERAWEFIRWQCRAQRDA